MFGAIKTITGALVALAIFAGPAAASSSVDLSNPAFAPITGGTSVPIGAAEFCKTHRRDCAPNTGIDVEALTDANWRQLVAINDQVNGYVSPVTHDHYDFNRTLTDNWGLPPLEDAAEAKPIDDIWK